MKFSPFKVKQYIRIIATVAAVTTGVGYSHADDLFLQMKRKEEAKSLERDQCLRFASKTAERDFRRIGIAQSIDGVDTGMLITTVCQEWNKGKEVLVLDGFYVNDRVQRIPLSVDGCNFHLTITMNSKMSKYNVESSYVKECTNSGNRATGWRVSYKEVRKGETVSSIVDGSGRFCGILIVKDSPSFDSLPVQTGFNEHFSTFDEAAASVCRKSAANK